MVRAGTILTLFVAATVSADVVAREALSPFVVGILGQENAIIPFADFDGRLWRNSWPNFPDGDRDLIPLERIPDAWWGRSTLQHTWEIIDTNGRRRNLQISGTTFARLGSDCSGSVALTTDLPEKTYQYAVLAANRPGIVRPIRSLTPDSADWRVLVALLPAMYQKYEGPAWKHVREDFRPDLSALRSVPQLTAAFAFADSSGEYTYFESSRQFARRPEQLGSERSLITGWLWRSSPAKALQIVSVQGATNDEDDKGVASFHPLGAVLGTRRLFWLGVLSSYGGNVLTVFSVSRAGIKQLLAVEYGIC